MHLVAVLVSVVLFACLCGASAASVNKSARTHERDARAARARGVAERRRWVRQRIAYLAWRATGIPYRYGGASPTSGFDCSGLVQWVFSRVGVRLPHYTYSLWRDGRPVARGGLQVGDVVFFAGLGHVGIYIGHGRVIHAPRPGTRVQVARLSGWFSSSYVGARRYAL